MHNAIRNLIHLVILILTTLLFYKISPSYKLQAAGMYLPLSSGYSKVNPNSIKVVMGNDYDGSIYAFKQIGTVTVTVPFTNNFQNAENRALDFAKNLVSNSGANILELDMISGPRTWFNTSNQVVTIQAKVLKG